MTAEWVRSALPTKYRPTLDRPLPFGRGFEDVTYCDWINERTPRIFSILVELGIPHGIFAIIDQAFDDEDLPLSLADIPLLDLPGRNKDSKIDFEFDRVQSEIILPVTKSRAKHGGNVAKEVPAAPKKLAIEVMSTESNVVDTVHISGSTYKTFTRRRVPFGKAPLFTSREDFLKEIQLIKQTACQHSVKLKTAYFGEDSGYVLFRPTLKTSLRSLSNGLHKPFSGLPAETQRATLLNWPHCLASALRFLHDHGIHHGKVVPSNIFIDTLNRVNLGFSDDMPAIQCQRRDYDVEARVYAAPERSSRSSPNVVTPKKPPRARRSRALSFARYSSDISTRSGSPTGRSSSPSRSSISTADSGWPLPSKPLMTPTRDSQFSTPYPLDGAFSPPLRLPPLSLPRDGSDMNSQPTSVNPNLYNVTMPTIAEKLMLDRFPGDIFSLACITLDIVSLLVSGKFSFTPSREKFKRVMPGFLDNSFQGNMPAVIKHMASLESAAAARREPEFRGIKPLLDLVRRMLDSTPDSRPTALEVLRRMEEILIMDANLPYMHCGGGGLC